MINDSFCGEPTSTLYWVSRCNINVNFVPSPTDSHRLISESSLFIQEDSDTTSVLTISIFVSKLVMVI